MTTRPTSLSSSTCRTLLLIGSLASIFACSSGTDTPADGTGGKAMGTGGATQTGGATGQTGGSTGGAATGGATETGGTKATGGATGGNANAGGSTGGAVATGGQAQGGGAPQGGAGARGGQGGSGDTGVAAMLDGIRVDDPCVANSPTTSMATCTHLMLMNGGFKGTKQVTIGGTAGTTYDVTVRVRGIVETTQMDGGTRSTDTSTFSYMNMTFLKTPFTIGGTINRGDYQQWRISVSNPKQVYTLNDYGKVGHYVFKLDYEATIPMAANASVSLEGVDTNDHLIVDYEKYTVDGLTPPMNWGQFVQLNVVSAKAH